MSIAGLDVGDERWPGLRGGYRIPYDPRSALCSLEQGKDVEAAWQELSTELYYQGDVGEASYAAVPHLVRIYDKLFGHDFSMGIRQAVLEVSGECTAHKSWIH